MPQRTQEFLQFLFHYEEHKSVSYCIYMSGSFLLYGSFLIITFAQDIGFFLYVIIMVLMMISKVYEHLHELSQLILTIT